MLPSRRHMNLRDHAMGVSSPLGSNHAHEAVRKKRRLRIHDEKYSTGKELLVNPDFFPGIREGDLVEITPSPDGTVERKWNEGTEKRKKKHAHNEIRGGKNLVSSRCINRTDGEIDRLHGCF